VVVHGELKKMDVIVRADAKFEDNILMVLKKTVDKAVEDILDA
jgi:hypothetical protein